MIRVLAADADVLIPLVGRRPHLTCGELERLVRPLLDRTVELTLATLRRASIPPEDVDAVGVRRRHAGYPAGPEDALLYQRGVRRRTAPTVTTG